jgi:hypothetical protein
MGKKHEAIVGRSDLYFLNPMKIVRSKVKNQASKLTKKEMTQIAESIKKFGVMTPIRVYKNDKDQMVLIDGKKRLTTVLYMLKHNYHKDNKQLENFLTAIPAIISKKPEKTFVTETDEQFIEFYKTINMSFNDNPPVIEEIKSSEELIMDFLAVSIDYLKNNKSLKAKEKVTISGKLMKLIELFKKQIA